jgi:hypothetical protein
MIVLMRILNFPRENDFHENSGFWLTCLWESPILVMSHKHAIYVRKSRIRRGTFKYVQKYFYFCMIILMRILNFAIEKDFHENSGFWLIYLRAYENPLFWSCLISAPYMYENLEFSWARSNMYKNNVTFACEFSWGFWILLHRKVFIRILYFGSYTLVHKWACLWVSPILESFAWAIKWVLHLHFTPEFSTLILHMNFTLEFNSLLLHPFTFAWSNSWGFSIFYIEIFHQQLDFTWAISWEFWIFLYRNVFMTNWISVYTVWTKCRILMSTPYTVCTKI